MFDDLRTGLRLMVVMTVLTGIIYPAVITGIAQVAFHDKANGSLVFSNGTIVGSALIGQNFTRPGYFHPRPSAAGPNGYDPTATGGSNLGPTSAKLVSDVKLRVVQYCRENDLPYDESTSSAGVPIPADAVTASASGLDPHISPANAELQARRVAIARGIPIERVMDLIVQNTDRRFLGFLGEPGVNVLRLNLALDGR